MMKPQTKKKILFLITKSNWGGAQRYVYDLATHLPHTYDVVVVHGGNGELVEKLQAAHVRTIAITALQRDISLKKEFAAIRELSVIIKTERPDIVHINSSKAGLYGSLLGRLQAVPHIVFTAHGWAFNEIRPRWQRLILKILHYLTIISAHTTIAVSNGLKAQLSWPGAHAKMVVINPGREPISFKTRTDARKQIQPYRNDEGVWLVTIAELHPIKRLEVALQAVAQLKSDYPHLRYYIFGEGELQQSLEILITSLGLSNNVFLLGHNPDAATFLPAFDIFVLPSQSESYGYVLLEAGLARVPIVASNVGGIPDIVSHQETGLLVPANSSKHLQQALKQLIESKKLRDKLSTQQLLVARKRDVHKMVEETIACYESSNS